MTDFALGDIVVMKMGGPWMTVVGIHEGVYLGGRISGASYRCVWFDLGHRLHSDQFEPDYLKPVELPA